MSLVGVSCKNCGRQMIFHNDFARELCKKQWKQKTGDIRSYF